MPPDQHNDDGSATSVDRTESVQDRFSPHVLREYAFLGDGHRGALCGPRGDIVWMCAPRWHGDAVFSALLGGPGVYAINPVEPFVWGGYYEQRSLIWRNRWVTTSGIIECREALLLPADPDRITLLRRIEPKYDARLRAELDVRAGFGRHGMEVQGLDEKGRWVIRSGPLWARWSGAAHAVLEPDGVLRASILSQAGQHHDLVLEIAPGSDWGGHPDPDQAWSATQRAWNHAVPRLNGLLGTRDAEQAVAVLRGMTGPGKGTAAAATTSLPERAQTGRNYDYRYTWLRDQCYTGIAAAAAGVPSLAADAISFVTARVLEDGDRLRPMYTVDGTPLPQQHRLDLPGYPGGRIVVTGNQAVQQFQLDTYGEILQLLAIGAQLDLFDADGRQALQIAGRAIADRWQREDAGIWELDNEWWTHSRLACVAGLYTAAEIAPSPRERDDFRALAETILTETTRRCLHPAGYWQRSPQRRGVDAALLLPPVRGAIPTHDPRTGATIDAVTEQLVQDNHVYRFRHDERPLGEDEGAFLMCGFLLAIAEACRGNPTRAIRLFERNRTVSGPPGLFSEEFDVVQRQLRGNLPQAFVHAMLLESSARLSESTA